jgi:hypothetical protein
MVLALVMALALSLSSWPSSCLRPSRKAAAPHQGCDGAACRVIPAGQPIHDLRVVGAQLDTLQDGAERLLPHLVRAVAEIRRSLDRPGGDVGARQVPARVGLPGARLVETGEQVAQPVNDRAVRGVEELAGTLRAHPEVDGERLDRRRGLGQLAGAFDRAPLAGAGLRGGRGQGSSRSGVTPRARKRSEARYVS